MLFMSLLVVGGVIAHIAESAAVSYRSWRIHRERRKLRRRAAKRRNTVQPCR